MASIAELWYSLEARDQDGLTVSSGGSKAIDFVPAVVQRQTQALTASTYHALTVPTGARLLIIKPGSAVSLVLKGASGDTGIPITPASSPLGFDIIISLGATPTPGILNNSLSAQSCELIFL